MSSDAPPAHEPQEHGIYYIGKVGQRTQLTRAPNVSQPPPVLPPPSHLVGPRPQLPPLSKLPVSSRPQIPPAPLPTTAAFDHAAIAQTPSSQALGLIPTALQTPATLAQPGQPSRNFAPPHPTLFAQGASYQSKNPGTVFEALSPVDYESDGRSFFSTAGPYGPSLYTSGPVSSFQSPNTALHGATTPPSGVASIARLPRPALLQSPSIPGLASQSQSGGSLSDRFILTIRQQPLAARACGHGERDRRVIDPPPIVQLELKKYDPTSKADLTEIQYPFNIMHCALLAVPPENQSPRQPTSGPNPYAPNPTGSDVTAVPDPAQADRISRRLMGTLVASPFVAVDPDAPESSNPHARLSTFFCFPDLSCRQNGSYKLRFTLMRVPMGPEAGAESGQQQQQQQQQQQGSVYGSVDSNEFKVYSAKGFPGMTASTRLVWELKKQGLAVPVRKGKDRGQGGEKDTRKSSGGVGVSASESTSQGEGEEEEERHNPDTSRTHRKRGWRADSP